MTEEELEKVIKGFLRGGEKRYSIYPPGERVTWYYDKSKKCVCQRVQSLSDEYINTYTDTQIREYLRGMEYEDWKEVSLYRL